MLRKALVGSAVLALSAGSLAIGTSNVSASAGARVALGANPAWATASARVGAYDAASAVPVRVYLHLQDEAALDSLINAVSDPASASYAHYIDSNQFHARYSPSAANVAAVSAWLKSEGFTIGDVPANRMFVPALGSAAAVERAFSVHLGRYRVQGDVIRGTDVAPSVPASLSSVVSGVVGVDDTEALFKPLLRTDNGPYAPPEPGFRNAQPCSDFWAQKVQHGLPAYGKWGTSAPWIECKKTPPMLRKAYGYDGAVAKGIDGRGVTVGIVDAFASPTMLKDAIEYSKRNDPQHVMRASQYREVVPKGIFKVPESNPCDPQGWYGEETVDVEAVHAMAPGANIVYSGGKDCFDRALEAALNHLVDGQLVNMVSNSYGPLGEDVPASTYNAYNQIFKQAAAEGIGIYFASGDEGDESTPPDNGGLGHPEPDLWGTHPLVTSVGGTTTGIGADGRIAVETAWETTITQLDAAHNRWSPSAPGVFYYGSGGGTSTHFAQPAYQKGVVPASMANRRGTPRRVSPDVAMDGDPNTGMTIGQTQTFPAGTMYGEYRLGGTSLSSPLFAGVMALADQAAGFHHGFINPRLYRLAGSSALRDVQPHGPLSILRRDYTNGINPNGGYDPPTRRTLDTGGNTIHSAVGYDDETGLGVPRGWHFLQAMS